jgi:cytochrome b
MKKPAMLKILNPILFVLIAWQVVTVILLKVMPSELIGELHEWNGYAIGVAVIFHLYLNWSWIKTNFLTKKKPAAGTRNQKSAVSGQ